MNEKIEIKLSPWMKQSMEKLGIENYPARATNGSAGFDLMASLQEATTILPRQHKLIPTGIFLCMPPHMVADIRPRSGLALKHGISVLNAPGTIDSDYRGEIGVILINHSDTPYVVEPLARVAQMVFFTLPATDMVEIVDFAEEHNERKEGGFGSTGVGIKG